MHHYHSIQWEFKLGKTMWMYKGDANKKVYPHMVSEYLYGGWRFGRNLKHLEGTIDNCGGKVWVYNQKMDITKRIQSNLLEEWKSKGWTEGRGPNLMNGPSSRCTGRIWITHKTTYETKMIHPEKLEWFVFRGWIRGRIMVTERDENASL